MKNRLPFETVEDQNCFQLFRKQFFTLKYVFRRQRGFKCNSLKKKFWLQVSISEKLRTWSKSNLKISLLNNLERKSNFILLHHN